MARRLSQPLLEAVEQEIALPFLSACLVRYCDLGERGVRVEIVEASTLEVVATLTLPPGTPVEVEE